MTGLNSEAPGMDARQCPDECKVAVVFLTRGAEERAGSDVSWRPAKTSRNFDGCVIP